MKKRVLVVSSANIDFIQNVDRVPYAGETVMDREATYSYVPGGKGANSAIAFARFGADCVFVCRLGADQNGARLKSLYRSEGIDTRFIIEDKDAPTGLASIIVEKSGKNRIMVFPGANAALTPAELEDPFTCYPDAVYLQLEISDEAVIEASRLAAERGIPVFVDAAPARLDFPLSSLGRVEIFSPNESECRVFTGITPVNEESALRAAIRLKKQVDAKYIVIKLGERGAFMFDGSEYFVYPAESVTPVDTTAAGDVFTAVMTYSYIQNGNIHSAIRMANVAAAISVTREGASTSIPTLAEVLEYRETKSRAAAAAAHTTEHGSAQTDNTSNESADDVDSADLSDATDSAEDITQ